jgi:hypothetical protein
MALGAAHTVVISLRARPDRRLETIDELSRLGPGLGGGAAEFMLRDRPQHRGEFVSIGARGCFESHLAALRRGVGKRNLLILEDDIRFDVKAAPLAHRTLSGDDNWDILFGGYEFFDDAPYAPPLGVSETPPSVNPYQAHCIAFSGRILPRLIGFLETLASRPAGHPDGGPMHVDGAYWHFRRQNPDIRAVMVYPPVGLQRSSRSDIAPPSALDRAPGVATLKRLGRGLMAGGRRA